MSDDQEIRQLEKARRRSSKAIPVYASLLILVIVLFYALGRIWTVPVWIEYIVLG
jgi:hypothetical protein